MTIYTRPAWPKDGATIAEAFERTLLPALEQEIGLPKELAAAPRRQGGGWLDGYGENWLGPDRPRRIDRNGERRDSAAKTADAAFYGFLRDGQLIATGHRSVVQDGEPSVIGPSAWEQLLLDRNNNCAKDGKTVRCWGVRIFPVLSSPVAAQRIAGLSLMDAFERFVANDPEFLAARMRDGSNERRALHYVYGSEHPVFERAGCFWNTATEVSAGADSPIGFLSAEPGDGTMRKAHDVACDRVAALFDLLRKGALVANGHGHDGRRIDISPAQWQSHRCYVDFVTGDVFYLSEKDKPARLFSGLGLVEARHVSDGTNERVTADGAWRLLPGETAKAFAKRLFDTAEYPQELFAEAGGIEAFCKGVSDRSARALSPSAIGKQLRAETRLREISAATNVAPFLGK